MFKSVKERWGSHPCAIRTCIRSNLPWFLIDLGFANKIGDCEAIQAKHHWYNKDNTKSGCYHCRVVQEGQLWKK